MLQILDHGDLLLQNWSAKVSEVDSTETRLNVSTKFTSDEAQSTSHLLTPI